MFAMGLQETGKTTFLAAFWNVVNATDVQGALRLERTAGDMQYLNEIREAWADCKPIPRTGPSSDKPVIMIIDNGSGQITDLTWTDMLGESFERQWTDRAWSRRYQLLVDDAVGILLFVHPRKTNESQLVSESHAAVRAVLGPQVPAETLDPEASEKPEPYAAEKVPTQVQLVDLLQFVDARRASGVIRVAVVVSAWDLVQKTGGGTEKPDTWCAARLPLLYQFLGMNEQRFEPSYFGVSAQGGDYVNAQAMRKEHHRASDRISIVHRDKVSTDITLPVRWSLGEDV